MMLFFPILMAVQGGKDGIIRLLNRAHLGGVHGELQDLQAPGAVLFSAPAVWRGPGGGTWVYLGDDGNVTALRLRTDAHGVSRLVVAWTAQVAGTSPVVSGGVVFVSGSGALSALEACSGRILWSSRQASAGGTGSGWRQRSCTPGMSPWRIASVFSGISGIVPSPGGPRGPAPGPRTGSDSRAPEAPGG